MTGFFLKTDDMKTFLRNKNEQTVQNAKLCEFWANKLFVVSALFLEQLKTIQIP
jgi:hypothetical protein